LTVLKRIAAWEIICVKLPLSKAGGEYKMILLRLVLLMVTDFKLGCEMGNFGGQVTVGNGLALIPDGTELSLYLVLEKTT
jgi:hypothetical protein